MKFAGKLYRVNKGKDRVHSYKVTISRETATKLDVAEKCGVLIKVSKHEFPAVISKTNNAKNSFVYSFTIPRSIGSKLKLGNIELCLISKSTSEFGFLNTIINESSIKMPIYFFNKGKKTLAWIYSKGCKTVELPSNISLRKNEYSLLEVMGAFLCEGLKARKKGHNLNRLSFGNAEPTEIEWFVKACRDLFGIKITDWSVQILFPNKNDKTTESLKNYWSRYGFRKKRIFVYGNKTVKAEHGVCLIYIQNSTLAEIFFKIYEKCKELAPLNKENALDFFRGLSRGDLGVSVRKNKEIKSITYSTDKKSDVELFNKICDRLHLESSNPYFASSCWNSYLVGNINFKRIVDLDAIVHKKRKLRLLKGFLKSHKSIFRKYLKSVKCGKNTTKKAAKYLNVSIVTSRASFSNLRKLGYLKIEKVGNYKANTHILTRQGEETLSFFENIEKGVKYD
jgi:hypothetical protein